MTAQQQRAAASMLSRPNPVAMTQAALMRARGRAQQTVTKPAGILRGGQQSLRNQSSGMMNINNYQLTAAAAGGSQFLQVTFLFHHLFNQHLIYSAFLCSLVFFSI